MGSSSTTRIVVDACSELITNPSFHMWRAGAILATTYPLLSRASKVLPFTAKLSNIHP